jgi:glycosyltransferase involved in cell wall biosynthesis
MSHKIALVIPCFNEELRWDSDYWNEINNVCKIDLVFVDDGSIDKTAELIQCFTATNPRSHYVKLRQNCGKAEAVRTGFNFLLNDACRSFDWIGFLDADKCIPVNEVDRIIRLAQLDIYKNIESVWTSRFRLSGHSIERRPFRHILGRLVAFILNSFSGGLPRDTQCGLKLFRPTSNFASVLSLPFSTRWLFEIEIIERWRILSGKNLKIYEEPLAQWRDVPGSKINLSQSLKIVREILIIKRIQIKNFF